MGNSRGGYFRGRCEVGRTRKPLSSTERVSYKELRDCERELTKLVPLIVALAEYRCGGANLRSPTGGWAYGIPRYSETSEALGAV
jgi:hypothetical protein